MALLTIAKRGLGHPSSRISLEGTAVPGEPSPSVAWHCGVMWHCKNRQRCLNRNDISIMESMLQSLVTVYFTGISANADPH